MADETSIEWAAITLPDGSHHPGHTFNPWIGCQSVSPGCDHCYAEAMDTRLSGGLHFGPHAPRKALSDANWAKPAAWNRRALKEGGVHRVFCGSMCDVFDNRSPMGERERLWDTIKATPALTWLVLTKRPQNILRMLPPWYRIGDLDNVVIGTTVENAEQAEERIHHIIRAPFRRRFLSVEPLLGWVNLRGVASHRAGATRYDALLGNALDFGGRAVGTANRIDWVICGGESGREARPMHPAWARQVRDQCLDAGTPFLFKQWGEWAPVMGDVSLNSKRCLVFPDGTVLTGPDLPTTPGEVKAYHLQKSGAPALMVRLGKAAAGNVLDGRQHLAFPEDAPAAAEVAA